jgi:putative tryptophan/tyrosine transport system substrate-binding protein
MRVGRTGLIVALTLGLLARSLSADAQQPTRVPRIGILSDYSASLAVKSFEPFVGRLWDLGYIEGQNIAFEYRHGDGDNAILPSLAAELVCLQPEIILAVGTPATQAIKRVGVLWDPNFPPAVPEFRELRGTARSLNLELVPAEVRGPEGLEPAFRAMEDRRTGALTMEPGTVFEENMQRIAELTTNARLPAVGGRMFVEAGGLMSYAPDSADKYRRAAAYVNKILKGAKPADLPVEQPTKFELVINLKTAKSLGLTIPPLLLARATR